MDFGKNEDRFGRLSWSQKQKENNTKYLETQLKLFRKIDLGDFRKHEKLNLGKSDFNQLQRLRNQIIVAAADFEKDENLQPIVTSLLTKDIDEQLKHIQNAITIVDTTKRKISATMKE